jgi:hypothetical protein
MENPGQCADATAFAELSSRVAALEAEQARRLANDAASADAQVAQLPSPAGKKVPESFEEPLTPPYLARALVAIEDHMADMERFVAVGDDAAARMSKLAAASRACSALKRVCDDDDFHRLLVAMQLQASEHHSNIPNTVHGKLTVPGPVGAPNQSTVDFRDLEIQLLAIAGLPALHAQALVDGAMGAYDDQQSGWYSRLTNPMAFLADLRRLRDASCLTADLLAQGIRSKPARQRWKKVLTFGVGGVLIVAVNGLGTVLLGPVGAATSGAIGSAAIGIAVQQLVV